MIGPALPLLLLWAGGAVLFFVDGRRRAVGVSAALLVSAAAVACAALLWTAVVDVPRQAVTGGWPVGVGIRLRADALGTFFALISLVSIGAALAIETMKGVASRRFPALMLLTAAGLVGLFLTGDAFNFYVFFELSMIASFGLAAYGEEPRELRAGVVFALVNLVGSVFFLGSIAALYRITGTLDMGAIAAQMGSDVGPRTLIATLLFVALGVKLGLFPLHFWLPSVYRSTRPAVAAVLSGAVANIGAYGLLRFGLELFPGAVAAARPLLLGIGAATVVYGGLLAISRRSPSEVLGYSAIGQAGYVLLALAVGGPLGVAAAVLYAGVNALNKTLLFLTAGLGGPAVSLAFAVGALSVVGVPPTVGFAGKLELFRVGVAQESAWLLALLVVGGGLSFVYMFQAYQHEHWVPEHGSAGSRAVAVGLVLLAVLVGGAALWPEPLLATSRAAADALLGGS